ncbi:hypothetical protein LINPERPRIM_LOCUS8918, partial [Linum perenne]
LDSRIAIQLLSGESEVTYQHSSEFASFHELLDRDWMVKVEHVYWEDNKIDDYLASLGHKLLYGIYSVSISDPTLSQFTLLGFSSLLD